MSEQRYDDIRKRLNPFLRKRFGLELVKIEFDGKWIGVGIRKWLK